MSAAEKINKLLAESGWEHGGSGAPEGTEWVWFWSPIDPETGVGDDTRVAALPPFEAELLVRALNDRENLLAACDAALAYIPGSEVRSWPPGFALKKKAMELLKAATTNARGGK